MQRGTLFLLFISSFLSLSGQRKIASVELAFRFTTAQEIQLKALVCPESWSAKTEITLLKANNVQVSLLRAGSRKNIQFDYDGKIVSINFLELPHPLAQLEIRYTLSKEFLEQSAAWQYLDGGFLLNDFNMAAGSTLNAEAGLLFPCFNRAEHYWSLNLVVPVNWKVSSPFKEDFQVELYGEVAHYFSSAQAQNPASLFLAAGPFKSDEPERILKELAEREEEEALMQISEAERLTRQLQKDYADLLAFIAVKKLEPWTQKDLEKLLKPTKLYSKLYLKHAMLAPGTKKEVNFLTDQKILLNSAESAVQASLWQEEYYQQLLGKDYLDAYLHKRFSMGLMQREHSWNLYLNRYLASEGLALADTFRLRDTTLPLNTREYLSTASALYKKRAAISLGLSYQYSYPRKAMRLIISQPDSNLFGQINLSALAIAATDSLAASFNLHFNRRGTISWPLAGAPRSMNIELKSEKWNFFTLNEQRPETYYLYDFSRSQDPLRKRKALLALLETSNANLLATVMGIAIDSGERDLQILALQKAEKLNAIGKQKLAESIKLLSEQSEDVKLKQKAAEAYKIVAP